MAEDRPVDDPVQELASLRRDLADMKSTLMARTARRPTGDVEATIRVAAKPDTLLLQGQAVLKTAYPVLWQWVLDQGLVTAGVFADGGTTFTLPDYRARVPRGVASGETVGQLVGADTKTIAVANLPAHKHNVTVDDHDQHRHGFLTDQDGAHGGHFPGTQVNVQSGGSFGVAAWNSGGSGVGTHNHGGTTAYSPLSSHNVTESNIGSGTAFDLRQASFGVNWLVYT